MRLPKPCCELTSPKSVLWRPATALAAALLALALGGCDRTADEDSDLSAEAVPVKRGHLRISVLEGGDLQSANPVSVRSELEGRSAILKLIPEGTQVKKGEWLVTLDGASIQENLNRQEIKLEDARSALKQAEEAMEIQKKKKEEDIAAAQTAFELATRASEAYRAEGGTLNLERRRRESILALAKEKRKRAEDRAEASLRLNQKTYISKTELEADLLSHKQSIEDEAIAQRELEYFLEWTAQDELKKLQSEVDVKTLALSRVKQQADSELKQRQDQQSAREKSYKLEEAQRDKLKANFARVEILSPADGLVVYARSERGGRMGGSEPIGLGKEVREQEELLSIPDLSQMVVEVDIHESHVKKINAGQRAWVRVDAIPNKTFPATVTRVSLVPSTQGSWMNPDLKVYETRVMLEEEVAGVKPGMHAQVDILVQEVPDALQIPLQAVRQSGSKTYAYVKKGTEVALQEIKVGLNNEATVHILEGLNENDLVYLTPPPGAPPLPEPEKTPFLEPGTGTQPAAAGAQPGTGTPRPFDDGNIPTGGQEGRGPGFGQMTEEQRKAMQERLARMTPEERQKFGEAMRRRGGGDGSGRRGRNAEGGTPPAGTGGGSEATESPAPAGGG